MRLPPLDELARRWVEVERMLARATARTACYEPIDILRLVMANQMTLAFIEEGERLAAVFVVELRCYPRRRVLDVPFVAGEGLRGWLAPAMRFLEDHARKLGCAAITGFGRAGWRRMGFRDAGSLWVWDI